MPTDYQPDYRKAAIAGEEWQRCLHVECNNPYAGTPTIRFDEERRMLLGNGTTIGVPAGSVTEEFTDPAVLFPMLDPVTNAPIGQDASYGALYAMLFSVYIYLAKRRDAGGGADQEQLLIIEEQ